MKAIIEFARLATFIFCIAYLQAAKSVRPLKYFLEYLLYLLSVCNEICKTHLEYDIHSKQQQ